MPEGDSLHRAARRLQALVGEQIDATAPHARGAAVAERVDGKRLLSARAVGKDLLLEFEGGVVVRSHLRMKGRWSVVARGSRRAGRPWLVLRGAEHEAVLWHGPVLEVERGSTQRLGPDILADRPDFDSMLRNLRRTPQSRAVGGALLDQRIVAGIGNLWRAEALWEARVSPWRQLGELGDEELRLTLEESARLMRAALHGEYRQPTIYRRSGRPCRRCETPVLSRGQGDANRIAYWCPACQR
jgi:endonuclease VIII